ncbi:nitroreductase family protein [uncultured Clostridium sp.]|uniref:nitroreductase family protein n=1 Tax=uncultured Clostridium sp. TaxID=59620 RepID=UPI0032176F5A
MNRLEAINKRCSRRTYIDKPIEKSKTRYMEELISKVSHRKTKSIEEMYESDDNVPQWFINGMKAVQKAPSAINK